jgi:hypothetical protein
MLDTQTASIYNGAVDVFENLQRRNCMAWKICFKFQGKRFCFHIPLLVKRFEIPGPEPWVDSDLVKAKFAKDLQILATIDELATGLSPKARKQVQETVRQSVEAGGLPPDINLDFGG